MHRTALFPHLDGWSHINLGIILGVAVSIFENPALNKVL
jgi:hypothetical protein